jgi:hypothetical protein
MKIIFKIVCVFLLLFILPAVHSSDVSYNYKIAENGESTVFVFIEDHDLVNLQLPPDVEDPKIRGGIYIPSENGIEVSIGEDMAVVAYTTAYNTRKESGIWYFESEKTTNTNEVIVILPSSVKIIQSNPKAHITRSKFVKVLWNNTNVTNLNVSYIFEENNEDITIEEKINNEEFADNNPSSKIALYLFMILTVGMILYFVINKKIFKQNRVSEKTHFDLQDHVINIESKNEEKEEMKEKEIKKDEPNISEAQMNIIRAVNHNEALILRILLHNNKHMKRKKGSVISLISSIVGVLAIHTCSIGMPICASTFGIGFFSACLE